MSPYVFWLAALLALWWWATRRPITRHQRRSDRSDIKRIRAAQRRVLP